MRLKNTKAKDIKFGDKIFVYNNIYVQCGIDFENNIIYFYDETNFADKISFPICTLYGGDFYLPLIKK